MSQYSLGNHKLSHWNYSNTVCVVKENDRNNTTQTLRGLFSLRDMSTHNGVPERVRGEREEEFVFLALHTVDLRLQFSGF